MDERVVLMQHCRPMNKRTSLLLLTAFLGLMAGQSSAGTKLVQSWRDPAAGPLRFKKVLVLCFAPYDSQQLFGEGEIVRLMKKTQGVSAHQIMSVPDARDKDKLRAIMERDGFDGALTLRYLDTAHELVDTGGYIPSMTDFWGYYAGVLSIDYAVGYVQMERHIQMETQIFSMKDNKLVWSGYTETRNPKTAKEVVDGVASTVAKALRKQKLIE